MENGWRTLTLIGLELQCVKNPPNLVGMIIATKSSDQSLVDLGSFKEVIFQEPQDDNT